MHRIAFGLLLAAALPAAAVTPADDVYTHARVYTADGRPEASAFAVADGVLVYVGDAAGARAWRGPRTHVHDLGGRRVLPGLVDAHVHPIDVIDIGECDLGARALSLAQLVRTVRACQARHPAAPGEWITVRQWAATSGNTPDAQYPTVRAALDAVSSDHPVELLGDDGHHSAYNGRALAGAVDAAGSVVGLNRATLATVFAPLRLFIGADAQGEPDGRVDEDARMRITARHAHYDNDIRRVLQHPERIPAAFNAAGITTVLEAAFAPEAMPVYDTLWAEGRLTLRVTLAQHHDPAHVLTPDGAPDYDLMVARAVAVRDRYAHHPLVRADFVKLFADGEVEGNPFASTDVHGNAAMLHVYRTPRFAHGPDGQARVTGYGPPACAVDGEAADRACPMSRGTLQYPREVELEWARRMHLAGFNLHIHVIGDRAVRTAVDAIEAARAADGNAGTHDSLAHVQFAAPEDVARMGRDRLYLAYTYSWAMHDPAYDPSVFPYLSETPDDPYFEEQMYPVRQSLAAGAVLTAGSDAPVASRDPRPFVNIATAVTRRQRGGRTLSTAETIPVEAAIDAYTLHGAEMLGRDGECGSITVGKRADFVVLDRDPIALAHAGRADDIADVRVDETWFDGRRVYRRHEVAARP